MKLNQNTYFKIIVLFNCFFHQTTFGQIAKQVPLLSGWERIYIRNVGNFDLPPTMEIKKGTFKEFYNESTKIKSYDAPKLIAQQKGLNNFNRESYQRYARILLETTYGSPRSYENLNFDISVFTQNDIIELDEIYKKQIHQDLIESDIKLINWYPLKLEKINGMPCLHFNFTRQIEDNPIVIVHIYQFHNNDRLHSLTLSYRSSEKNYWKSDYETILSSFRITNIR